jgi:hypothetical protein
MFGRSIPKHADEVKVGPLKTSTMPTGAAAGRETAPSCPDVNHRGGNVTARLSETVPMQRCLRRPQSLYRQLHVQALDSWRVVRGPRRSKQKHWNNATHDAQSLKSELHLPNNRRLAHGTQTAVDVSIIPPPRHTSPSYSTADCPGVTAHCASVKRSAKLSAPFGAISQATSAWR